MNHARILIAAAAVTATTTLSSPLTFARGELSSVGAVRQDLRESDAQVMIGDGEQQPAGAKTSNSPIGARANENRSD